MLNKKVFLKGIKRLETAFRDAPEFTKKQINFYYDKTKEWDELTFKFAIEEVIDNKERLAPNLIAILNKHREKAWEEAECFRNNESLAKEMENAKVTG